MTLVEKLEKQRQLKADIEDARQKLLYGSVDQELAYRRYMRAQARLSGFKRKCRMGLA